MREISDLWTADRRLRSAALLLLLLLVASVAPALGQTPAAQALERMRAAYERFDYAAVEERAQAALQNYEAYRPEELAEVHALLGQVRFAQGRRDEARAQFEAALSLNPTLELDPLLVSPKILRFFRGVKAQVNPERPVEASAPGVPRYVVVEDPRLEAALRSMVLPGWGQLYKEQTIKGWTLVGLWGGTLAGAGLAHLTRARAKEAYLAARDAQVIAENYQAYSTWHKVRNNLLLAAALVWGYSYVDALLARPSLPQEHRAWRLAPRLTQRGSGVQFVLQF